MIPPYPTTDDGLAEALDVLGHTPQAVADTLRRGGHRGDVCSEASCPLVAYLRAAFPDADNIRVTGTDAFFFNGHTKVEGRLPRAVARFTDLFDMRGDFPDLAGAA